MASKKEKKKASKPSQARRGLSWAWVCVLVIVSIVVSCGACALYLPDRTPGILQRPQEVTSAPASVQAWSESRSMTVTPVISQSQAISSNSMGMVTADHHAYGLESGKAAFSVDGQPVVSLATTVPPWRDLQYYDKGEDVRALNNELVRLGYAADANSDVYSWNTGNAWNSLLKSCGAAGTSDGGFSMASVLWIPRDSVKVTDWTAAMGSQVTQGSAIGAIPGSLQKLQLPAALQGSGDYTITVFGQSTQLTAGQSEITDAGFLEAVESTQDWSSQTSDSLASGIDATLRSSSQQEVLRVPAAAVYGLDDSGSSGCIVSQGTPVHVDVVGSGMGVSLVAPTDGTDVSSIATVGIGSAVKDATCE
ncbi:MAG: hypothetical protein PUF97_04360 [Bifidobacteriaceae bacterium]|nr:hypothetical protein [Bifidobacteriaceae bacterium]